MKRNSLARVLLLLTVAAAGLGQSEDEPYFSLRSNHTFGSNGQPLVALSASNVDTLDFRVYRINDPLQFFQQLEDAHEFGGRVQRPPPGGKHRAHLHGYHDRENVGADDAEAEPSRVGEMRVWVHGAAKIGPAA